MINMAEETNANVTIPSLAQIGEQRKTTKVRKGMGNAKYSTLITTIPADMCKTLNITAGDSLMWSVAPGSRVMGVLKIDPMLSEHAALMQDLVEKLEKSDLPAEDKEKVKAMKEVLSAMGPIPKLTEQQKKDEVRKMLKQKKKKG